MTRNTFNTYKNLHDGKQFSHINLLTLTSDILHSKNIKESTIQDREAKRNLGWISSHTKQKQRKYHVQFQISEARKS